MANAAPAATGDQLLRIETAGAVLTIGLNRPAKRNALNDGIILAIQDCFSNLPDGIGAVVIHGIGDHFSSGLDLSELTEHDATDGLLHSQMWHRVFDRVQYCRVPVIAALRGAVIGGGLRPDTSRSGHVGLPVSGNDAKLVPNNGKLEVRAKGPNVTPGYWRQPELTAAAFDEEGFYRFGDALKPVDAGDFDQGFDFDGRIAEDFKLASGTWVSVGPLRARFVAACAPLVRDVVIAGINRDEISALVILDLDGCRLINPALPSDDLAATASDPLIREAFRERLTRFLATGTGSSTKVTRALLLDTPLSIDRGEVTDKGSINQRAVLDHRTGLIDELYSPTPSGRVITL